MDIDVLMLTYYDFSNTGWRFSRMLEGLGLRVKMFKGKEHEFNYPVQAEVFGPLAKVRPVAKYPIVVNCPELAPWVERAKVVHFTSSTFISTGVDLSGRHVVVNHGGSTFRNGTNPTRMLFNSLVDYSIIQCPDLLGLGAKNEVLIYYPVDTELLRPSYDREDDRIVIGHFPSSPGSKGTSMIVKTINRLEADPLLRKKFRYVGVRDLTRGRVDWETHLDRIRRCDVIIETVCPVLRGRKFGEFGNMCFESAALGKVVITNNLKEDTYIGQYGERPAIFRANDKKELEAQLRRVIGMDDAELLEAKTESRGWVKRNHGMEATAERLWDKVYSNFFEEKSDVDYSRHSGIGQQVL